MDILNIQALIKEGKLVSQSDINPDETYLQVGVFQPGNRKSGAANPNAYASYAIAVSSILSSSVTWGSIIGSLSSQTDLQSALDGKYSTSNPAGYITSAALSPYLTSATAASTYYPLTNPANYITSAALSPYLTSATAASTYLTISNASSTYLTIANASSTYLTSASASSTYLTIASASSTYQTLLGYTAENVANKSIDGTLAANSDTLYPSQKAVKTYVDANAPVVKTSGTTLYSSNPLAGAGSFSTTDSILLGFEAGANTAGTTYNISLGLGAGKNNSGNDVIAIGQQTLANNTSGNSVAVGSLSGLGNTGVSLTAVGWSSGNGNTGFVTTAFGYRAGNNNSGSFLLGMGYDAGKNNSGSNVIAIGNSAGVNNSLNGQFIISNSSLPTYPDRATAQATIVGGSAGNTYLYYNSTSGAIEGIRF